MTVVQDDLALMSAIAAGDPSALRDLYDRHAGQVLALCLRILRDRAEAEEALGDVFLELWEKADRFRETRGAPLSYMMTLARSRAIDRLRRRQRTGALVDSHPSLEAVAPAAQAAADAGPYLDMAASEQKAKIRRALAGLSAAERRAVELSFFDGLSHGEIAKTLQEPLGTVKSRIRQGLLRLRDALGDEYGRMETA
jgi:RNA polymerase sigma-70 factor (ECF subfamily)